MNKILSVIIPTRDEAASIGKIIHSIKESLSTYDYEIIVVDDGSRDKTREIALSNGAIVVSHKNNLGKGAAIQTGARNASGDVIVFIDGDGAHDPHDIPMVIAPVLKSKADLIIGSRFLPDSNVPAFSPIRRFSNILASFIISIIISFVLPIVTLFKCRINWILLTDTQSGFKVIKKEAWQKLTLISKGFPIETEIIYEAAKGNLTITEVPISCYWNSDLSRLSIIRDGLETLKLLARKLIGDIGRR